MIKKLLGIRKIERFLKDLSDKMGIHWGHTDNLYRLHKENRKKIEELEKDLHKKSSDLKSLMEEVIYRLDKSSDVGVSKSKDKEEATERYVPSVESDVTILEILHQNASFNEDSALTTTQVYDNIPFSITKRGLRKKLRTLLKQGVVDTFKRKNRRYWHIRTGKLSDVKKVIKEKERVKE